MNDSGLPEAGIDAGGVFKEFLSSLVERAFDANLGLFLRNPAAQLYPNPDSSAVVPNDSKLFEFVGSVLGKAVFEGIQVCPIACIAFTNEWSSSTIRPVLNRTPSCDKHRSARHCAHRSTFPSLHFSLASYSAARIILTSFMDWTLSCTNHFFRLKSTKVT